MNYMRRPKQPATNGSNQYPESHGVCGIWLACGPLPRRHSDLSFLAILPIVMCLAESAERARREDRLPSFGEKLKREREKRKVSLDEIALSTKIGTRMLHALEEEKFEQLPGGIFNKGFVRAYARHLGLDEDQAVADYLEAAGEGTPSRLEAPPEVRILPARESESDAPGKGLPWGILAAALLVLALALSIWSYLGREQRQPAATAPVRPAKPDTLAMQPAVPAQTAPTNSDASQNPPVAHPPAAIMQAKSITSDAPPPAGGFSITVTANDDSWITIAADGRPSPPPYFFQVATPEPSKPAAKLSSKPGTSAPLRFLSTAKSLPLRVPMAKLRHSPSMPRAWSPPRRVPNRQARKGSFHSSRGLIPSIEPAPRLFTATPCN